MELGKAFYGLRLAACIAAMCLVAFCAAKGTAAVPGQEAQQTPAQNAVARPIGTIKTIAGNTITLTTDGGSEVNVVVQDTTRLVRIAPGQKDLKDAAPITMQELQAGDRLLVRGKLAADGKSVLAASMLAMKKTDIAEKLARERAEWQRHGAGGLVSSVDPATGAITITTSALGAKKDLVIHTSKDTILRRYAPGSVKFDDAKPGPLDAIKPGDQLRARGARSADGGELAADEIVSGTFRNVAGTITKVDAGAGTISVLDLATKKPVTVMITADSQLRSLPLPMAQRIAMRLKAAPADAASAAHAPASSAPQTGDSPAGNGRGMGRPGGTGDFQEAINRMPPASLANLQKGDAVLIVAIPGTPDGRITAVTLLSGVEPILQASPKDSASTILSPWSLGGEPSGDAATP
jgi:Domain of unknown function (DUF5666)